MAELIAVSAGSFNAPLLTFLTPDQYEYDPEVFIACETGMKYTRLDGKARLNLSAYYYDYRDYQVFQFVGTSGAVFNADATYFGGEIELWSNPVDNVDLIIGMSYIEPEVEDIEVASNVFRDVLPSFTPRFQFSGVFRYTWPGALSGGSVALQLDANYASRQYSNINNFDSQVQEDYWIGNACLEWSSRDTQWDVALFVKNISDTRNKLLGFEFGSISGAAEIAFGAPRWAGVSIRPNF